MHIECSVQEDLKLLDQKLAYQSELSFARLYNNPLTSGLRKHMRRSPNVEMLKAVDENDNIVGSVRAYERRSLPSADFMSSVIKQGIGKLLIEIEKRSPTAQSSLFTETQY